MYVTVKSPARGQIPPPPPPSDPAGQAKQEKCNCKFSCLSASRPSLCWHWSLCTFRSDASKSCHLFSGCSVLRYHHPSHMSLCRDERSTTETESNDKSVDSFQVAIQCAKTKTKCNTRFIILINHLQVQFESDWHLLPLYTVLFKPLPFPASGQKLSCGSDPVYPAGSSKARKIPNFSKL